MDKRVSCLFEKGITVINEDKLIRESKSLYCLNVVQDEIVDPFTF
jgi:hypothetical protein